MQPPSGLLQFRQMISRCACFVLAAVLPLVAANIDVTGQNTVFLNTGESLLFTVPVANFVTDAHSLGVSSNPVSVTFQLLAAPSSGPTEFTVDLQSGDGSIDTGMSGPLSFAPGTLASSLYTGPVAALSWTFYLSSSLSARIFAGSSAVLFVRNDGMPVTLGLGPFTLQQDLYVTLAGSTFSVGALQGTVWLDPPGEAPEPSSALLLAGSLAVLFPIALVRKR
jgi:hypothetical protein